MLHICGHTCRRQGTMQLHQQAGGSIVSYALCQGSSYSAMATVHIARVATSWGRPTTDATPDHEHARIVLSAVSCVPIQAHLDALEQLRIVLGRTSWRRPLCFKSAARQSAVQVVTSTWHRRASMTLCLTMWDLELRACKPMICPHC